MAVEEVAVEECNESDTEEAAVEEVEEVKEDEGNQVADGQEPPPQVRGMAVPAEPTDEERSIHMLTHLEFAP